MNNPKETKLGLGNLLNSKDIDPQETSEWLEAFKQTIDIEGGDRAAFLLNQLIVEAKRAELSLPSLLRTPYLNTIDVNQEPNFPGNLKIEAKISALVRWNALAMVVKANRKYGELGGHIATYASSADLFEVGFNHFFKAGANADLIYFQPHSAPGVYSRAFLEGRLTRDELSKYRQESEGDGLSSYCHPWLMPKFWQFPTGSMGLGPINAIYQARFIRYMENRGILEKSRRKVWCFVGDGEMDEPESLAALSLAAREKLDNLIFVINCNLQRLDGPVRGNGSIVQELEGLFGGANWKVIKLLWGSNWDPLFAKDKEGLILRRLNEMVDGELQTYAAMDGRFNREHVFHKYPELKDLVQHLSDNDIDQLQRGGHDPVKIYAAYDSATNTTDRPTVILAQTKKGFGMGHWGQGKMGAHQQKKLESDALFAFRDRFGLKISDADVENLAFIRPNRDSEEMAYLHERRRSLGGFLPHRREKSDTSLVASEMSFSKTLDGTGGREQSTTMVFVNLLAKLLKDGTLGKNIVPIVADEARTFGMQALFRQIAIYSPFGQLYEPEDKGELLFYKETTDGQILEEGITEAGAISSWIAAATSYSTFNLQTLPFYIFYSCFGFQRIGDLIWAAGDSRSRGFLIGATAGRTTLSGEGLQHEDGSSHILLSTVPNCLSYDPAYGYELGIIIKNGIKRMMENQEDIFYYITVMNENYVHPAMTKGAEEGIIKGMYRLTGKSKKTKQKLPTVQLLGSGVILRQVLEASELLNDDWGILSDVWSVTSFTELQRDGHSAERHNKLKPDDKPVITWVEQCLGPKQGPVIAATDYMRSLPELIRPWIKNKYVTLGTDGYGRSDTRKNLRDFFEVSAKHIVISSLKALVDLDLIEKKILGNALKNLNRYEEAYIAFLEALKELPGHHGK